MKHIRLVRIEQLTNWLYLEVLQMSFMKHIFVVVLLSVLFAPSARADLVLVENGQPRATIVVAADAGGVTQQAAQELQTYLERISGAHLDIRSENENVTGTRILVGPGKAVEAMGVEIPSGFTNQMNEEGYVVRTAGSDLVLAGNESGSYRGTLYAVYDFLETLGCRWFFPGNYGEVVPKHDTIAIGDMDRTERPDFRFRNIWYSGWMPVSDTNRTDFGTWVDRNRMNNLQGLSLPGDGSIVRLAPAEQYFESNPEIYAVDEQGERTKDMLCLTEPEAVRIAVKTITDTFRADPSALSFGFAPPDGHPLCHCDRCTAAIPGFTGWGMGDPSLSDLWFGFANAVATEVYKEFPDRWLFTNGYANRVRPPEGVGKLAPKLGIQSAMISICTLHPIGDPVCIQRQVYKTIFDRATRDLNSVFVYDYDPGKGLDGMPFPALHNLEHDFPYFKDRNIWGFWTEGQNCWMVTHLNYYARAKLMWNAKTDVRALVRDYCEKFYGAAADPVEDYIWTLEDAVGESRVHETWGDLIAWQAILTPEVMRRLDEDIHRAEALVQDDANKEHVRVFSLVHDNTKAFVTMENCAARGDFTGAAKAADDMFAMRDKIAEVDSALLPYTPEWTRGRSTTPEWFRDMYRGLAAKAGGDQGDLLTLLPERWEFKTDPDNVGVIEEWYLPGQGGPWDNVDTTRSWDLQGYQDAEGRVYGGKAWYRTTFRMPDNASDAPLHLTLGGVYNRGIGIWVNGQLVYHSPGQNSREPFDVDVTGYLRPGEMNSLAVLVNTDPARYSRGGLHRRVFIWQGK